jgi:hypothetical protein
VPSTCPSHFAARGLVAVPQPETASPDWRPDKRNWKRSGRSAECSGATLQRLRVTSTSLRSAVKTRTRTRNGLRSVASSTTEPVVTSSNDDTATTARGSLFSSELLTQRRFVPKLIWTSSDSFQSRGKKPIRTSNCAIAAATRSRLNRTRSVVSSTRAQTSGASVANRATSECSSCFSRTGGRVATTFVAHSVEISMRMRLRAAVSSLTRTRIRTAHPPDHERLSPRGVAAPAGGRCRGCQRHRGG